MRTTRSDGMLSGRADSNLSFREFPQLGPRSRARGSDNVGLPTPRTVRGAPPTSRLESLPPETPRSAPLGGAGIFGNVSSQSILIDKQREHSPNSSQRQLFGSRHNYNRSRERSNTSEDYGLWTTNGSVQLAENLATSARKSEAQSQLGALRRTTTGSTGGGGLSLRDHARHCSSSEVAPTGSPIAGAPLKDAEPLVLPPASSSSGRHDSTAESTSHPSGQAEDKVRVIKPVESSRRACSRSELRAREREASVRTGQQPTDSTNYSTRGSEVDSVVDGALRTSGSMLVNVAHKALIGKGSYGVVFQAMDRDTNQLIAVKEIPLPSSSHRCATTQSSADPEGSLQRPLADVRKELALLKQLDHPNIVRCLGEEYTNDCLRIYMEYVAAGSVSQLLKTFGPFEEGQASKFTAQVLCGLVYLHAQHIIHRDLKGDNLLVDPSGVVKLADFGTARDVQAIMSTSPVAGTANFMAPEVVECAAVITEQADIWSVGCCVIEMLTGRPPLAHLTNQYSIMMLIASSASDDALLAQYITEDMQWSPAARRFVQRCLCRDPAARPTAEELLHDPWIVTPPVRLRAGDTDHIITSNVSMAASTPRDRLLSSSNQSSTSIAPRVRSTPKQSNIKRKERLKRRARKRGSTPPNGPETTLARKTSSDEAVSGSAGSEVSRQYTGDHSQRHVSSMKGPRRISHGPYLYPQMSGLQATPSLSPLGQVGIALPSSYLPSLHSSSLSSPLVDGRSSPYKGYVQSSQQPSMLPCVQRSAEYAKTPTALRSTRSLKKELNPSVVRLSVDDLTCRAPDSSSFTGGSHNDSKDSVTAVSRRSQGDTALQRDAEVESSLPVPPSILSPSSFRSANAQKKQKRITT